MKKCSIVIDYNTNEQWCIDMDYATIKMYRTISPKVDVVIYKKFAPQVRKMVKLNEIRYLESCD